MSALVLAVGLAVFAWRGVARGIDRGSDFSMMFSSSKAWLDGGNPYQFEDQMAALAEAGGRTDQWTDQYFIALYPPTLYVVLSPMTMLSWPTARALWLMLNLAMLGAMVWGLGRWFRLPTQPAAWMILAATVLLWGPVHTSITLGQTAIAVTTLGITGLVLARDGRTYAAGVLLGLAVAVKPQLGLLFLAFILIAQQWRVALAAALIAGGIAVVAVARLSMTAPTWSADLASNVHRFTHAGPGDPSSPTLAHQMMNLQPLLVRFIGHQPLADLLALSIAAVLAVLFLMKSRWGQDRRLLLGGWTVASLLAAYHRYYDATILLIPLVGLGVQLARGHRSGAVMTATVAAIVFMVPAPGILDIILGRQPFDAVLADWLWGALVLQHHTWALLILAVAMLRTPPWMTQPVEQARMDQPPAPPGTAIYP